MLYVIYVDLPSFFLLTAVVLCYCQLDYLIHLHFSFIDQAFSAF